MADHREAQVEKPRITKKPLGGGAIHVLRGAAMPQPVGRAAKEIIVDKHHAVANRAQIVFHR